MLVVPLLAAVPSPVKIDTHPPLCCTLRPEAMSQRAPRPLVPLPTVMLTDPLRPAVEAPVPKSRPPEFPALAQPLLKIKHPLDPDAPEFADRTRICPLVEDVPSPARMEIIPPVFDTLLPETEQSEPPTPLVPLPTKT